MNKNIETKNMPKRATAILAAAMLATCLTLPGAYASAETSDALAAATPSATTQVAKTKLKASNVTAKKLKYTGKAQKTQVTVKANGATLTQGVDYTLTVKNAKGKKVSKPKTCGTYATIVKGKGTYVGTIKKKFKVYSKNGKKWTAYWKAVPVTRTVTVVDDEAWDEPVYETVWYNWCSACGFETTDNEIFNKHMHSHYDNGEYASEGEYPKHIELEPIHHPAITHTEKKTTYKKVKAYHWA